ncbi:mandelate racemase/muconate lactonizing enzyme family protein [Teredinibacter turnerae]|uniref:mandelate racemase/muconate lactonizing enzyme family protein n=1 Tax=Teredinibacter turnerae TaxID=2426 RepID=UPI00036498A5|nr:enolase C-terminal domain-like protein [Teredinibacter turnerae]
MIITALALHETTIPFRLAFNHTTKSRSEVEGIILEVHTNSGAVGFGEALPRKYVTGETHTSVIKHATKTVLPRLLGMEFSSIEEIAIWFENFHNIFESIDPKEQCIKTLVEIAVLDAFGRDTEKPLIDLMGGAFPDSMTYSGVISAGKPEHVKKFVDAFQAMGVTEYKVKVGADDWAVDEAIISTLRNACGPEIDIRADANEAWDLDLATQRLGQLADLGVTSCEQPMPASLKQSYPALVSRVEGRIGVCIDESLCTLDDAKWFIANSGATIFNLRVSKNGGIMNTLKLGRMAHEHGIKCQIGSQVGETSILSRAAQIVSACLGDVIHHEGAFGTMLLEFDLCDSPINFGQYGKYRPNTIDGPGLGIDVSTENLQKMLSSISWESRLSEQSQAHALSL